MHTDAHVSFTLVVNKDEYIYSPKSIQKTLRCGTIFLLSRHYSNFMD